ncbi:unnamed protein product [Clonostachys chloroleuca]|uniref:ASST-domain-containing protein n=1 Tax=Clonostachys chloroleuca TaxID=1926264 RepID=A0AA35LVK5_9HYPO|nr:unnamed protein product [Clonostachys chloroleuca]
MAQRTLNTALVAFSLINFALADGSYRSRSDLSPPHLNITIPCEGRCAEGYLFVAPFTGHPDPVDHGPLQGAPYILSDTGDLVWSGFSYFSIWAGNFQAARWKGQDVLFSFEGAHNSLHGHGHGHHTLLDQHYNNVRELRAGNHLISDKHEFIIIDEKTALIQIYHPIEIDLSPWGGKEGQTWIVDARLQELDIETGEVLFEWSSLDHVDPFESALPLPLGQAGIAYNSSTAWDYFHINSITKGSDGHYLLSARHASTLYKINGTDGSVIWRLGGQNSDFTLGPNVTFGFQHHARYLSGHHDAVETISLFDNSVYGSESGGGGDKEVHLYPFSRGKYIELNHRAKTATLVKAFHPPNDSILAKSQGSLQTLPNHNVLINWGSEGQITEYSPDGTPIFHAFLDSGFLQDKIQNYRAFRYNWTGFSPETPALVAEEVSPTGRTNLHVSWNGDTATALWNFFWTEKSTSGAGEEETSTKQSKKVKCSGFETVLRIPAGFPGRAISHVYVQAFDGSGNLLATSGTVTPVKAHWRGGKSRLVKQDVVGAT